MRIEDIHPGKIYTYRRPDIKDGRVLALRIDRMSGVCASQHTVLVEAITPEGGQRKTWVAMPHELHDTTAEAKVAEQARELFIRQLIGMEFKAGQIRAILARVDALAPALRQYLVDAILARVDALAPALRQYLVDTAPHATPTHGTTHGMCKHCGTYWELKGATHE